MSGMVGLYRPDGLLDGRETAFSMMRALRDPASAVAWEEKGIIFGRSIAGAPGQPLGHDVANRLHESCSANISVYRSVDTIAIVDASLDNSDDLKHRLECPRPDASAAELVVRAYQKWGARCAGNFDGDFAVVIWDRRRSRLVCLRDRLGIKPFYYHFDAATGQFAFASRIPALLQLPSVRRRYDDETVAAFLASRTLESSTATFYEDVLRLPSGHVLMVEKGGLRRRCYWRLEPGDSNEKGDDASYVEGFRERFTSAVRRRLDGRRQMGVYLSGGLDSSALAATAARLSPTRGICGLTARYPHVEACDEGEYAASVAGHSGLQRYDVDATAFSIDHFAHLIAHHGQPLGSFNPMQKWHLLRRAKALDVDLMLDGFGGDEVVSHGIGYLGELADAGRWWRFARGAYGLGRTFDESGTSVSLGHLRRRLASRATGNRMTQAMRSMAAILIGALPAPDGESTAWLDFISKDFASRSDMSAIVAGSRRRRTGYGPEIDHHLAAVTTLSHSGHLDSLRTLHELWDIDVRFPFLDTDLLEFCLSLPGEQKLGKSYSRLVLRRSMEGTLPDDVRWRRDKTDFYPVLQEMLEAPAVRDTVRTIANTHELGEFVDRTALRNAEKRLDRKQAGRREMFSLWRILELGLWLMQAPEPAHSGNAPRCRQQPNARSYNQSPTV